MGNIIPVILSPAIERNRRQLARIVATLFAMVGLAEGAAVARVARLASPVYRAVLRVLRPAESAVRRLVVVAARGVTLKPPRVRAAFAGPAAAAASRKGRRRGAAFQLFDPRQRFGSGFGRRRQRIRCQPRPEPRLHVIDVGFDPRVPLFRKAAALVPPPPPAPVADNTVNALRLCRRLAAIRSALEDLPRQARRYARWQARPVETRRPQLASALRPGSPPGHRNKPMHKVDEILTECDWLARQARMQDTS